jgi:hypothetical protein
MVDLTSLQLTLVTALGTFVGTVIGSVVGYAISTRFQRNENLKESIPEVIIKPKPESITSGARKAWKAILFGASIGAILSFVFLQFAMPLITGPVSITIPSSEQLVTITILEPQDQQQVSTEIWIKGTFSNLPGGGGKSG